MKDFWICIGASAVASILFGGLLVGGIILNLWVKIRRKEKISDISYTIQDYQTVSPRNMEEGRAQHRASSVDAYNQPSTRSIFSSTTTVSHPPPSDATAYVAGQPKSSAFRKAADSFGSGKSPRLSPGNSAQSSSSSSAPSTGTTASFSSRSASSAYLDSPLEVPHNTAAGATPDIQALVRGDHMHALSMFRAVLLNKTK